MSDSHVHHFPRLAQQRRLTHTPDQLHDLLSQARPWHRYAAVTTLAALSGLCVGLVMPRGPVPRLRRSPHDRGHSRRLRLGSDPPFPLGDVARPGRADLVFELARLGASGPTVDGISIDGLFGPPGLHCWTRLLRARRRAADNCRRLPRCRRATLRAGPAASVRSRIGLGCPPRRDRARRARSFRSRLPPREAGERAADPRRERPRRSGKHRVAGAGAVNGSEQWIEIRAWSPDKPILLSIPGGPGQSDLALSRPTVGTWRRTSSLSPGPARHRQVLRVVRPEDADPQAGGRRHDRAHQLPAQALRRAQDLPLRRVGWRRIGVLAVQQHPGLYHAWIGSGQRSTREKPTCASTRTCWPTRPSTMTRGSRATSRLRRAAVQERLCLRLRDGPVRQAGGRLHRAQGVHQRA